MSETRHEDAEGCFRVSCLGKSIATVETRDDNVEKQPHRVGFRERHEFSNNLRDTAM